MALPFDRQKHLITGCILEGEFVFLYNKQTNDHLAKKNGVLFRVPHPEHNVGWARFVNLPFTSLEEARHLYQELPPDTNLDGYEVVASDFNFTENTLSLGFVLNGDLR